MVAELGLDQSAHRAHLQAESGPVELRHHLAASEMTEISAFDFGRTFGILTRLLGEVPASPDFLEDLLGAHLVFHQDVRATDFSGVFGEETTHAWWLRDRSAAN